MLNNNLTLGVDSDGNVITKTIPSDDDDVSVSDTFVISSNGGYYQIIPRDGSSSYIGTSGYSNYLAELDYSDYSESDQIKWTLTQYTGQHAYGANFYIAGELISGRQITITPTVWYTSNSITGFTVEIPSAYANIATGIWNPIAGSLIVFLRKSGIFISTITFIDENGLVQGVVDKTISVASGMHDGIVHTFYNTAQQKLMKPNGTTSLTVEALNYSDTSFMFMFEYAGDGYYKIRNESNGYYLRAQPSNTSGAIILQSSNASGNYALWRFTEVSEDTYLIQSKNQYLRETSTPLYLAISGSTVVQSSSTVTAMWTVKPLKMNITVFYDEAFVSRRGPERYLDFINDIFFKENDYNISIAGVIKDRFGMLLNLNIPNAPYQSYPYTQSCNCSNHLDHICYNNSTIQSTYTCEAEEIPTTKDSDCMEGLHHKQGNAMLDQLQCELLSNSDHLEILFTGFTTCSLFNGGCVTIVGGWSTVGASNAVILTQSDERYTRYVTFHELLHLLVTYDHDTPDPTYSYCVHGDMDREIYPEIIDKLLTCSVCTSQANANKLRYYNHD